LTPEELAREQLAMVVDRLTRNTIVLSLPQDEEGVTTEMVSASVMQQLRVVLDASLIHLPLPIRQGGEYSIPLKFTYRGRNDLELKLLVKD